MKYFFLSLFLLLFAGTSVAQEISGRAVFQTASALSTVTVDSSAGMSTAQQQALNAKLRQAMRKTYELEFSATESLYRELTSLDPVGTGQTTEVVGVGHGVDGGLYKHTRNRELVETRDVFGKLFLVQGQLPVYDWKLTGDTKQVGDYTAYEAIWTQRDTIGSVSDSADDVRMVTSKVTAWYTPEIPIQQGPAEYWGLPGFILEVDNGRLHILCTEIDVQPAGVPLSIDKPTKGKQISPAKFEVLYRSKVSELKKRYQAQREKGRS